jgi:hypothetical protein
MKTHAAIPGYTMGTSAVARSPVSLAEFELMQKSALFGPDDVRYLRMSYDVLEPHVDAILDVWYGFVGANPHLLEAFSGAMASRSAAIWTRSAAASANGYWTPQKPSTTSHGSTINTKSGCGITGQKRIRPTTSRLRPSFHSAICLRSSFRSPLR